MKQPPSPLVSVMELAIVEEVEEEREDVDEEVVVDITTEVVRNINITTTTAILRLSNNATKTQLVDNIKKRDFFLNLKLCGDGREWPD